MNEFPDPRPKRGAALGLFFLCAALGMIGAGFDTLQHVTPTWIGVLPGARAAMGAGVAVLALALGHGARLVLARRIEGAAPHARDHV